MSQPSTWLLIVALAATISCSGAQQYTCSSEGFHVNPNDCKKFIRCVDQWQNGNLIAYHFTCAPGE